MIQRVRTLVTYFLLTMLTSLAGIIYIILTFAFWALFFNPQQETPEIAYYKLIISGFGVGISFLVTLTVAARANQAEHFPLVVRLPSRLEYMTAVFLSAFIYSAALQLLLAVLALINGPSLVIGHLLELPPLWLSTLILSICLALHATDLITNGWSRIYVFGILAIFLFGQGITNETLVNGANMMFRFTSRQGWLDLSGAISRFSAYIAGSEFEIAHLFSFLFWPFRAISTASISGNFTIGQAIAPAILLFYAVILYLLAVDFFSGKDLAFTE